MDINALLKKYMDGTCSPEEERAAREWLDNHISDPTCDRLFSELLDATAVSDEEVGMKRSWSRIERFVESEAEQRHRRRRRSRTFRWLNVSIIAAAAIAFVMMIQPKEPVQWYEIYVDRGETQNITLCDGSTLWLNAGTKVIYPSRFDSDVRNIFVDGEIYADVTPDKDKPFIVSTANINVKVHGTQFGVKSFSEMENAEVVLISGSVTVEDSESSVFSKTLNPGDLLRYNHQNMSVERFDINPATYGSWRSSCNLRFINQSLEDIAAELERHFDVEIIIEDSALANTQYYASFINGEDLDKILHALNSNDSMRISRKNDIIVISPNN